MTLTGEERESIRTGVVADHFELLEESVLRGDFDLAVAMRAHDLNLVVLDEGTLEAMYAQGRAWTVVEGIAAPGFTDHSEEAEAYRRAVEEFRRLRAEALVMVRRRLEAHP